MRIALARKVRAVSYHPEMNISALYFLTRYSEVTLQGRRHSESKITNINTNSSFAFGVLVVGALSHYLDCV